MHRFISLISHKLRTPLVTIRAYPRLLLTENAVSPLNDFQKNALLTIQKQCQLMEDMVNQSVAFSSLDPEELLCQKMSGSELLTEALKLMPDDHKGKLSQVKPSGDLSRLFVHADPTLMRHAVRNIVENAFKFGAKQVEVAGHAENGSVIVSFKDDGPGIPPEDIERVFDRFYQVEKTFCGQVPGAGLGLTMVRQTVEAHGGKVWAESKLDKGTTLFLKLPAAPTSSTIPPLANPIRLNLWVMPNAGFDTQRVMQKKSCPSSASKIPDMRSGSPFSRGIMPGTNSLPWLSARITVIHRTSCRLAAPGIRPWRPLGP